MEDPDYSLQMLYIRGVRASCAVIAPRIDDKRFHLVVNAQALKYNVLAYKELIKVSSTEDALPRNDVVAIVEQQA